MYVGVPVSVEPLPPPLDSPVPSLSWWGWGFAAPQFHNTAKNLCVCQSGRVVGGWGSPWPSGPCPVSGAVISLGGGWGEVAGKRSQPHFWHLPPELASSLCSSGPGTKTGPKSSAKAHSHLPRQARAVHCLLRVGGSFLNSAPKFVYMGEEKERGGRGGGGEE